MIVRSVTPADVPAVAEIYGHHVLHGLGTFEETPPSHAEMASRMGAIHGLRLPYVVAETEDRIVGFAYAGPFRPRAAYRYTVEDSVYIAADIIGAGVGKMLLARLIAECEAAEMRQMIAVIGDSGNAGSINLHRSLGFETLGAAPGVGFKHGRWVDIVWMQRSLNGGQTRDPDGPGLKF